MNHKQYGVADSLAGFPSGGNEKVRQRQDFIYYLCRGPVLVYAPLRNCLNHIPYHGDMISSAQHSLFNNGVKCFPYRFRKHTPDIIFHKYKSPLIQINSVPIYGLRSFQKDIFYMYHPAGTYQIHPANTG